MARTDPSSNQYSPGSASSPLMLTAPEPLPSTVTVTLYWDWTKLAPM